MLLVVSCLAALGLHHYEETSRASMLGRFDQKVVQGAGFVGVYLDELIDRTRLIASRQLGAGSIDDADAAGTAADLGVPMAIVLDDAGRRNLLDNAARYGRPPVAVSVPDPRGRRADRRDRRR